MLGEIPILASEQRLLDESGVEESEGSADKPKGASNKPRVLADGTYATETAFSTSTSSSSGTLKAGAQNKPPLRSLILAGDFYTGASLAVALTKLVLRFCASSKDARACNELQVEAMLIMSSILHVGQSKFVTMPIDPDSADRIWNCIRTIGEAMSNGEPVEDVFLRDTKAAYSKMILAQEVLHSLSSLVAILSVLSQKKAAEKKGKDTKKTVVQVDDLLAFRQFSKKGADDVFDVSRFLISPFFVK